MRTGSTQERQSGSGVVVRRGHRGAADAGCQQADAQDEDRCGEQPHAEIPIDLIAESGRNRHEHEHHAGFVRRAQSPCAIGLRASTALDVPELPEPGVRVASERQQTDLKTLIQAYLHILC